MASSWIPLLLELEEQMSMQSLSSAEVELGPG
jgi:hypothetical protein